MSKVLVFTEFAPGSNQAKKGALELLTATRQAGLHTQALVLGSGAQTVAQSLAGWGVKEAFVSDHADFDRYNPELFAEAVASAIRDSGAEVVLATSSMLARDLFPRVAARLDTAAVSDCTELKFSGSAPQVRRPLYAGKCSAEVSFMGSGPKMILMRANQLPVGEPTGGGAVQIKTIPSPSSQGLRSLIKDVVKGATGKLDLTEANIIVAGGRGLKEASNFKLLNDLADTCGATVGASRAVVDAGWVPHSMQVGQTGKTVAPSLYIAVGISGAIQHLAGMSGSKVIVAINKDANAPIFQKATYGIVGDLFDVVPALTTEFKSLLSQ
ncbi:MAG TPA: electron transfer flavoprotein subunit alpha/FixB family protein [Pseudobdellovibrionaceae bacterium]|nr:electron transfer flavoprotein subunit alpha/FixB family protein [Pseudobdellovibrionaceae bacterium]